MTLSHIQVIEEAENRLLKAVIANDKRTLAKMLHPEIVFTDENGQTFVGFDSIPYLNTEILLLESSEICTRNITFFTNIAIVNSVENRRGKYRGICFERKLRINRSWKFSGRGWQLISANLVLLLETPFKIDP
ncbi:nuclear transport factor 2 family protein [Flavobacterium sp.]|uniref:nuclear transport factor 2 family protein n=1 Tax=Flavobacterium sp. TaxID=239 RepID=UPI00121DA437|nr:nuclear transport factor 2 family protein [Flavobacterium sp.]RZJ69654.1 MAG: nuclear transport factor 2 family protein [Flavobacterium sp.]